MNEKETMREKMARLGRSRSPAKVAAVRSNLRKATAARRARKIDLIKAARAVKQGMSLRKAAAEIGRCRYDTLRDFIQKMERESN